MVAESVVNSVLRSDLPLGAKALIWEASVHLPRRGTKWVAAFNGETGEPVWRSSGLSNRRAAQALARETSGLRPTGCRRPIGQEKLDRGVQPTCRIGTGPHFSEL
jgi:hypothetical protein